VIAERCDAVITMLPDGHAVRAVTLDVEGLLAGFAPGAVLIDMSSSSPVGTRELGERLAARDVRMIDAPVSGGVRKAEDATLAIMVGGEVQTIERCNPVLEAMGKQIFLTGALGSGHAMKALNNYVSAAGLAAAVEAVLAAARFGLDPGKVVDVLNASTGMNNSTLNKFHRFILSRAFDSGFSLDLMVKDLKTALEVAHSSGTPAPSPRRALRRGARRRRHSVQAWTTPPWRGTGAARRNGAGEEVVSYGPDFGTEMANSDPKSNELKLDPDKLYLEEILTDRRVGTLRRLTPVTRDGAPDATRPVAYVGETRF